MYLHMDYGLLETVTVAYGEGWRAVGGAGKGAGNNFTKENSEESTVDDTEMYTQLCNNYLYN